MVIFLSPGWLVKPPNKYINAMHEKLAHAIYDVFISLFCPLLSSLNVDILF